jgi:hypothetical protein
VRGVRVTALFGLVSIPVAGLVLLLAVPELDVRWEHHPSHLWLVLGVAVVNVLLGIVASEAATQRHDARLFLVSLALLSSAGFLALHALATPGVLLDGPNQGFAIATPVGFALASVFAAASALVGERGGGMSPSAMRWLRAGLGLVIVAWALASLSGVRILSRPPAVESPIELRVAAPVAIVPYAFAATRYAGLFRRRGRALPLAIAVAFGSILFAARSEYRRTRSITAAFGGVYLEPTLDRIDRRSRRPSATSSPRSARPPRSRGSGVARQRSRCCSPTSPDSPRSPRDGRRARSSRC